MFSINYARSGTAGRFRWICEFTAREAQTLLQRPPSSSAALMSALLHMHPDEAAREWTSHAPATTLEPQARTGGNPPSRRAPCVWSLGGAAARLPHSKQLTT